MLKIIFSEVKNISWICLKNMNFEPYLLLLSLLHLTFAGTVQDNCEVCNELGDNFVKGLERTARSNFGGGNTNWEEKSLGSYATSETRLVEITEKLCESASKERKCHAFIEEHEEILEKWYFKVYPQTKDTDIKKWLCMDELKFCCPENHYGPSCEPCLGGTERPCKDNGNCVGAGFREGTGKCKCDSGYSGDFCDQCRDGHYQVSKNDTHTECSVCDISCEKTCTGAGPEKCDACRAGYKMSEDKVCKDVDECETDKVKCKKSEYCSNTIGSFVCMKCDAACASCLGDGADKCIKCRTGYLMDDTSCKDIDECTEDESLCTRSTNMKCLNTPGSYKCTCTGGYEMLGDQCVDPDTITRSDKSTKKKKKKKAKKKTYSQFTHFKYIACVLLFALSGWFLKGHTVGSSILCITMTIILYNIATEYG